MSQWGLPARRSGAKTIIMDAERQEILAEAEEAVHKLRRFQRLGLVPRDGDFFPAVFYPPLRDYPRATADALLQGWAPPAGGLLAVYFHIPFCYKCCAFCHIPVVTGWSDADKRRYVDCLEQEMDLFMERFGLTRIRARSLSLGGGTPTCMPPRLLEHFFKVLSSRLDLRRCTQIGVDLDPATATGAEGQERLDIMRRHGVDRLCYGVQSLRDDVLEGMHRAHDSAGAREAIRRSREAGFKVNIELIVGYPTETIDSWLDIMEQAVGLGVDELQLYRMKVVPYRERAGSISTLFRTHPQLFPNVEDTMRMLRIAILLLRRHGYEENMRRFYTRTPEDYSHYLMDQMVRHKDQIRFVQNSRDVKGYQQIVGQGRLPLEYGLILDDESLLRRAFSMPLRYTWIDPQRFSRRTGRQVHDVFQSKVRRLEQEGLVEPVDGGLRQTDWGAFFAHEVAQQFHHPRHLRFPREAYEEGPLNPYVDNRI